MWQNKEPALPWSRCILTTAFMLDNGVFLQFLAGSKDLHLLSFQIDSGAHPASYWGAPWLFQRKWSSHSSSSSVEVRASGAILPFPPPMCLYGVHRDKSTIPYVVRWRNTNVSFWKLDGVCGEGILCKWKTKTYNVLKNNAFWYVMPCRRVVIYRHFGGMWNLLLRTTASLFLSAYKAEKFFWNVDKFLPGCVVSHVSRLHFSQSPSWDRELSHKHFWLGNLINIGKFIMQVTWEDII